MIENIVKRASEMGIKTIRFSIMDQYKTTKKYMEELGYDYSKFYDGASMHARDDVREQIETFMDSLIDKYGVTMSTCAEPLSSNSRIKRDACLSVNAVNNMLGTNVPQSAGTGKRKLCSCFGGKTDLLKYDNVCASSCAYCYAHHNNDNILKYYNEDGSLKDMPLTRVSKTEQPTTPAVEQPAITDTTELLKDDNGAPLVVYRGYAMKENRFASKIEETVAGTASDYISNGFYFTSDPEEAQMYAESHTDKSEEPPTAEHPEGGRINRHYVGDYAKVSKFNLKIGKGLLEFKDLHEFNRNKPEDILVML